MFSFLSIFLFKPKKLTDTLIPEEFHIVSNTGVSGLECYDEWVLWYAHTAYLTGGTVSSFPDTEEPENGAPMSTLK